MCVYSLPLPSRCCYRRSPPAPDCRGGTRWPGPLFHTHISDDGSKRFTFEAAPLDVLPTRLQEGDDNRLSRRDKSLLERREALQDEQLTQMLATRKYCRSGYIVLSQTSWKIRGECNESASQADRDAFPNQAGWQE